MICPVMLLLTIPLEISLFTSGSVIRMIGITELEQDVTINFTSSCFGVFHEHDDYGLKGSDCHTT